MATYLICHGAWSGGWSWKKMRRLLSAAGHEVVAPTYTGLGERAHLAHAMIDLETHIQDVLGVIEYEDLRDFILVGHSYGGMVVTGVADRVPARIRHLVYLDAFVPSDGQSLASLAGEGTPLRASTIGSSRPIHRHRTPRRRMWPGSRRADAISPRVASARRFASPVGRPPFPAPTSTARRRSGMMFSGQFADRFRDDPGWRFHAMDASHSPNITAPEALAALLLAACLIHGHRRRAEG